ncbi:hypothetical protein JRQ81_015025, partial [Phrynocephalus forsythii]
QGQPCLASKIRYFCFQPAQKQTFLLKNGKRKTDSISPVEKPDIAASQNDSSSSQSARELSLNYRSCSFNVQARIFLDSSDFIPSPALYNLMKLLGEGMEMKL